MTKHRIAALLIMAVALVCGCSHRSTPQGVIDNETLISFLVDAYRLEAFNSISSKSDNDTLSSGVRAAYDDILRRHSLTKEEVEYSLDYYGNHPEEYTDILDEVAKRLTALNEANSK